MPLEYRVSSVFWGASFRLIIQRPVEDPMADVYMSIWEENNWYAIQAKPSREDLAAVNLQRLGVEVLLPKIMQEKLMWGVPRMFIKPLFPCYFFARFSPMQHLHSINNARGVRRVVGSGNVLLPIAEEIIEAIQKKLGEGGCLTIKAKRPGAGDRVVIENGPLRGLEGVLEEELGDRKRVVILLEIIEYQARVLVEKRQLQIA